MKRMSTTLAAGAVLLAGLAATPALADGFADHLSGTAAVTTDYLFRGLTQTNGKPTVQASIGYDFGSGFSVGAWGSGIDFGDGRSSLETDYYANYATSFSGLDVTFGATYYAYPTSNGAWDYDYFEASMAVSHDFGAFSVNGSVWWSPEFFAHTGDAVYLAAGVAVPITDWLSATGNYGYQTIDVGGDYSNWNLGLTATLDKYSLGVMYSQTDLTGYDDAKVVATLSAAF